MVNALETTPETLAMRLKSMLNPLAIAGAELLSPEQKNDLLLELHNPRPHFAAAGGLLLCAIGAFHSGNEGGAISAMVITLSCLLARVVVRRRFLSKPSLEVGRRCILTFVLASLVSASGWALACFVLFQGSDIRTQVLVIGVGCAIVQGAAARAYTLPGVALWNVAIVLLGVALAAWAERMPFIAIACGLYVLFLASFVSLMVKLRMRQLRAEAKTASLLKELTQANKRLADTALKDGLTGVANRRAFDSGLLDALQMSSLSGRSLSLLLIDVDHFKSFNDTYGHLAGDACLCEIAACISETLASDATVARYGGEEFAVILRDSDEESARTIAENIRLAVQLRDLSDIPGAPEPRTVSIGAATTRHAKKTSPHALIKVADVALYDAKRSGRNIVIMAEWQSGDEPDARTSTSLRWKAAI